MSGVTIREVAAGEDGMRLDRWFHQHYPAVKHGRLEKLLRTGQIRVEGARAKASTRLEEGQAVRVPPLGDVAPGKPAAPPKVSEADLHFAEDLVIYSDEDVLVLNKPHGLAVQGGTKTVRHLDGMLDAFRFGGVERPRLVHRLDRDTSGVLVLARTRAAAQKLSLAFKHRATRKIYWALVLGVPSPLQGDIKVPLVKSVPPGGDARGELMIPAKPGDKDAMRALTRFCAVSQAGQKATWLALLPVTGRTHQLRAHCAFLGTPIVGDVKYGYGAGKEPLGGIPGSLHLHAHSLEIMHPQGRILRVEAPLPPHMAETWNFFGFDTDDWEDPFPREG